MLEHARELFSHHGQLVGRQGKPRESGYFGHDSVVKNPF
jgi:hypothetical protein